VTKSTAKAALDLNFQNECLLVDLSVSRRYTSSTSVKPSTDFGLSVELLGFGGSSKAGTQQVCRR
jgi:LPS-assembly protein